MPLPKGYQLTDKAYEWKDQTFQVPTRQDIEADNEVYKQQEDSFKEWDFQNEDKLGPQGEPLPEYAIGWKPTGEADFGIGLAGWWSKALSNVRASWKKGYEEGISISEAQTFAGG